MHRCAWPTPSIGENKNVAAFFNFGSADFQLERSGIEPGVRPVPIAECRLMQSV
jgi:hypothetical protein